MFGRAPRTTGLSWTAMACAPDGWEYVGDFVDNRRHGNGTMTHSDGSVYVGEWARGKCHGQGRYTNAD
eukprot:gene33930-41850_t